MKRFPGSGRGTFFYCGNNSFHLEAKAETIVSTGDIDLNKILGSQGMICWHEICSETLIKN
ncbi:hypothetical protein DCMF_18310 [Candidatus Formimonas warabiya]|uniref:Uncharacterized protein n=1 Tax=Formimonas warabiya TaxID=1761012 RepID=A0A3G1KVH0_FORW1|nr:hypothetical protein DCMF_18310 [Candidatus Formimonas warabiya]